MLTCPPANLTSALQTGSANRGRKGRFGTARVEENSSSCAFPTSFWRAFNELPVGFQCSRSKVPGTMVFPEHCTLTASFPSRSGRFSQFFSRKPDPAPSQTARPPRPKLTSTR